MHRANWRRLGAVSALGLALLKLAAANPDPKANNAVLIVRPDGCHDPARAQVTATAAGIVRGRRQTLRLHPAALATAGTYAIHRERPAVVSLAAKDVLGRRAGAVVPVTAEGFDRQLSRQFPHAPAESDIRAALVSLEAKLARR